MAGTESGTATDDADAPRVVVVCGLPGVGKSTVSETIADRLDATRFRTDVVRQDVVADPAYTDAERRRVYHELFDRAREALDRGRPVVLDGTFDRRENRADARALADDLEYPFHLVKVECDTDVVEDRIAAREDDPSEADLAVHHEIRADFEPIAVDHVVVDNSGDLGSTREQVAEHF